MWPPHSSKVEETAVEAPITLALSIHMDLSSVGFFYKSNLIVSEGKTSLTKP